MRMNRSALAVTAAIGLAVAGGSAFTASNTTTPVASVGQASTVTGGFAVSGLEYTLDELTTGDEIATVEFVLTAAANTNVAAKARVRLVTGAPYYECTTGAVSLQAVAFSCAITDDLAASAVDTLDIVGVSDYAA